MNSATLAKTKYISAEEASVKISAELGTSRTARCLAAWRAAGTGPRYLRLGRTIRYAEADIEAWLRSQLSPAAKGGRS